MNTTETRIALLLAKMDQLNYPGARLRTVGSIEVLAYPAEYIEALMAMRERLLEGDDGQ